MASRTVSVNLVASIGQYVSSMNAAAGATMRLGDTATANSKKAQSGFDLAGKGALIMGGAIVGGLAMAANASMKFEQSMSRVQAATRGSASDLEDLRAAAMKAGADTAFSAGEAADAITELAKAGVSTADILDGGLNGALSLAAAGELEVADAAEIAASAMTQFKLSGDDLPHVADLLAAGAGKAQGSVQDMGMALNQAGLIASAAGISIEETTGGLAAFASAGLIGSDAGTSLKTALQALQAPSGKSAELMADLGINAYDASGNFIGLAGLAGQLQDKLGGLTQAERDHAIAQIFGSDAARAANVLYQEGASGIAEWTAKVNDAGYAAEEAAIKQDNLAGDLEKLGGAFDAFLIQVGENGQGPLRAFVQAMTGIVDAGGSLLTFLSNVPGPVWVMVAALTAAHLLGGPLQTAFKMASFAIDVMTASARNAGGPVAALKSGLGGIPAMLGGPWGIAMMAATTGIAAIASNSAAAKTEIDEWSQSLRNGGRAAADLEAAVARQANAGFMEKVRQAFTFDDEHNIEEDFQAAKEATEAYYRSLDPVAEAQARVAEWTSTLAYRQEELGLTHEDTAIAAERHAYWSDILAQRQANLDAATKGATGATGEMATTVWSTFGTLEGYAAALGLDEEATKGLIDETSKLGQSLADFINPLGTYTGLLDEKKAAEEEAARKAAEAAGVSAESWRDFVVDTGFSFDEYMRRLEEQVTAQTNWQTNMLMLAGQVSQGTLNELARMGPEGAPLVADLVNRSDAELDAFDDITALRSKQATDAWGAQLTMAAPVLAAIGRTAGQGVVDELAAKLAAGTTTVAQIAADYGIALAGGVNPILTGLGKAPISGPAYRRAAPGFVGPIMPTMGPTRNADGNLYENHQAEIAPGGAWRVWAEPETGGEAYIPLSPNKRGRSMDIWRETGLRLGAPELKYFAFGGINDVPRPPSTAPYGVPISTAGDATMQKGYDEVRAWLTANTGGVAGGGATGGAWGSLWQLVKAAIPQARMNSTFRAGDPGYHGRGKAIDFGFGSGPGGAGSAGLASINRLLHDRVGGNLAELIYDGIGDDRPDLKNGRPLTYNAGTRAAHRNHVHAAVYHEGTDFVPQTGWAYLERGEAVIPAAANLQSREFSGGGRSGGGSAPVNVQVQARVFVGSREITDIVRVESTAIVDSALGALADRVIYAGG